MTNGQTGANRQTNIQTGTQLFFDALLTRSAFLTPPQAFGYPPAMPRRPRIAPGGHAYHVINRAVARLPIFRKSADYEAFERLLAEAMQRHPTRLLAYCLMPNHWHLVLWPRKDGELTAFVRWLTHTHVMRWHAHHRTTGSGHLYQGRFKSFPIERDSHLLTVCRYVERNALRAGLVRKAQSWRYNSLWLRENGDTQSRAILADWPVRRPRNWAAIVNRAQSREELEALRKCVARGAPFGSSGWQQRVATRLDLSHTLRQRGRPRKTRRETSE